MIAYGHAYGHGPFSAAFGQCPPPSDHSLIVPGHAYGHAYATYGHAEPTDTTSLLKERGGRSDPRRSL